MIDDIKDATKTPILGGDREDGAVEKAHRMDLSKCLRILQVNFRRILNKIKEFKSLVDATNADVIVGTESWLKNDINSREIFPGGFTIYRRDRNIRGGGLFICIREDIHSNLMWLDENSELLCVKIYRKQSHKALNIIGGYRKPGDNFFILESLCSYVKDERESSRIVIAGDFNLPRVNWEGSSTGGGNAQELVNNLIYEGGLRQVNYSPTRGDNILDIFLLKPWDSLMMCETI